MRGKIPQNVVRRWEDNPILGIGDVPFAVSDVYNAGCVRHNGEYRLMLTIEHLEGDCAIYCAQKPYCAQGC